MAVVALVAVSAGTVYLSEHLARRGALAEAERIAVRMTEFLVAPLLTEAMSGDGDRWSDLRRGVDNRLSDDSVGMVLIWTSAGQIMWASEPELAGLTVEPTEELLAALNGEVTATIDDEPEAVVDEITGGQQMLEVYAPLTVGQDDFAVEIYFGYDTIERQAALLRAEIIPLAVGSLMLLQLVQIPIAVSLVRRVRRQEVERADLLARSFTASERERRSIAGDVHDGPVQDLAGVSYALSALRASVPGDRQETVDRLVATVRDAVRSLRRLIVDIYPPDLSGAGLVVALDDVVVPLRATGLDVQVHAEPFGELAPHAAGVVYRTAREALANAARHAEAEHVHVTLSPAALDGVRAVRLEISDDGMGIRPAETGQPSDGHLGLRLVRDRIDEVGGILTIRSLPGGGTSVVAVVPAGEQQ